MQSVSSRSSGNRTRRRRSARVRLRIQIEIDMERESPVRAETITVSRYGAHIRVLDARGPLSAGERLRVKAGGAKEPQTARVVWLDKRAAAHYGIELDEPGDLWGVAFPVGDGEWHYERKAKAETQQSPPAPVFVVPAVAPKPATSKKPASEPVAQAGLVRIRVMGISAAHQSFAEATEMKLTSAQEGTTLLDHLVSCGTTLRVSCEDDSRITKARVLGISRKREAGKWRVRLLGEAAFQ